MEHLHSSLSASWLWVQCEQLLHAPAAMPSPLWWTEPSNHETKQTLPFLSCFYYVFCHSSEEKDLISTPCVWKTTVIFPGQNPLAHPWRWDASRPIGANTFLWIYSQLRKPLAPSSWSMRALYGSPLKPCTVSCSQQWRAPGRCKAYEIHSLATAKSRESFCFQNRENANRSGLCMKKEKESYPIVHLGQRVEVFSCPQSIHRSHIHGWCLGHQGSSSAWHAEGAQKQEFSSPTQWESLFPPTHVITHIWLSQCWRMLSPKHKKPLLPTRNPQDLAY